MTREDLIELDVFDGLDDIKTLVEAIFMAAHALPDRQHMNAISNLADLADKAIQRLYRKLDDATSDEIRAVAEAIRDARASA